jgi:phosphate transport system substrate-binding protein
VGKGAAVKWPAATSVGGKGNEGVAANVQRVKGAIGYVEYAYVKKNNLVFLQLQNRNGKYVSPDDLTFSAAAAGADWFSVPGMGVSIVDQKGDAAWPISTASFIIMYKDPVDKKASQEALKFFDWAFRNGKKAAEELDYVALPDSLTKQIRERVWSQIK